MATWLAHIRVADRLLDEFIVNDTNKCTSTFECGFGTVYDILERTKPCVVDYSFPAREFLAGNVAPDCGEPVPGGFDPPKEVTHWKSGNGQIDYERFRRELLLPEENIKNRVFLTGYFCHLMADALWSRLINEPLKERYKALYTSDREEFYRRVKPEWYANDFLFLERDPDFRGFRLFCEITEFPVDCIPYYRTDSVEKQIRFIQRYYLDPPERVENLTYLTPPEMDRWVEEAAKRIAERLRMGI